MRLIRSIPPLSATLLAALLLALAAPSAQAGFSDHYSVNILSIKSFRLILFPWDYKGQGPAGTDGPITIGQGGFDLYRGYAGMKKSKIKPSTLKSPVGNSVRKKIYFSYDGEIAFPLDTCDALVNERFIRIRCLGWTDKFWELDLESKQAFRILTRDLKRHFEARALGMSDLQESLLIRKQRLNLSSLSKDEIVFNDGEILLDTRKLEAWLMLSDDNMGLKALVSNTDYNVWWFYFLPASRFNSNILVDFNTEKVEYSLAIKQPKAPKNLRHAWFKNIQVDGSKQIRVGFNASKQMAAARKSGAIIDIPPKDGEVHVKTLNRVAPVVHGIKADAAFNGLDSKGNHGWWTRVERILYLSLLKDASCDTLVVPFQVDGYAIDRAGRSLMTRYLAEAIARSGEECVLDVSLASRALGINSRNYEFSDIYGLADTVKARRVIIGYVGHDRKGRMNVTLFAQKRKSGKKFSFENSPATMVRITGLRFTDEQLPYEVFKGRLGDMVKALGYGGLKAVKKRKYHSATGTIPESPRQLVSARPGNAVEETMRLQFLGLLSDENLAHREQLFERSLIMLEGVSTNSPDYSLLKARALLYLHRRPAALKALGEARTAAETALLQYMNGNLLELKPLVGNIQQPLMRLISFLELYDLHQKYSSISKTYGDINMQEPLGYSWKILLPGKLANLSQWSRQGYTADLKQLAMAALGQKGGGGPDGGADKKTYMNIAGQRVEAAMYDYFVRTVPAQGRLFLSGNGSSYTTGLDIVELAHDRSMQRTFGLAMARLDRDESGKMLDSLELMYADHPRFLALRYAALVYAIRKGRRDSNTLHKQMRLLENEIILGSQEVLRWNTEYVQPRFDTDFPSRSYNFSNSDYLLPDGLGFMTGYDGLSAKDRVSAITSCRGVLYSVKDFSEIRVCYNTLDSLGLKKDARRLLKDNAHRFKGLLQKTYFYSGRLNDDQGDEGLDHFKQAMKYNPDNHLVVQNYADRLVSMGRPKEAANAYMQYIKRVDGKEKYRLRLSNFAFYAGLRLFWAGEHELARPFLEKSFETESYSEGYMISAAMLKSIDGDMYGTAKAYTTAAARYNSPTGAVMMLKFIYAYGFFNDGDRIYQASLEKAMGKWLHNDSVFVGYRARGMSAHKFARWLKEIMYPSDIAKSTSPGARMQINTLYNTMVLRANLLDRRPPSGMHKLIVSKASPNRFWGSTLTGDAWLRNPAERGHTDDISDKYRAFAKGIAHLRRGNASKAYEIFSSYGFFLDKQYAPIVDFGLPYVVQSGILSGHHAPTERLVQEYGRIIDKGMSYHLSMAWLEADAGRISSALSSLELARFSIPYTNTRILPGWYQLVDTAVSLYKRTGKREFIDRALAYASMFQKIDPAMAWPYAIEARYSKDSAKRLRGLALTMYLDRNSLLIQDIPDDEKSRAMAWLPGNSPFHLKRPSFEDKPSAF